MRLSMTYDASGNVVTKLDAAAGRTMHIAYTSENRIAEVRDENHRVVGSYEYDDTGFRVRKVSRRVIDGEERVVETVSPSRYVTIERRLADGEGETSGTSVVNHIYVAGVRVAALSSSGRINYYLTDQVDSVTIVLDERGLVVTSREYLPFGEEWVSGGDTRNAAKYNSQELDRESGYYFYNARHYDPVLCRFVTPDVVIDGEYDTQGWNRYSYVRNNPIVYKDPTGNTKEGAVIGAIVGIINPLLGGTVLGAIVGDKISDMFYTNEKKSRESGKSMLAKSIIDANSRKNDSLLIKNLETLIEKSLGQKVDLKKGSHHVMIENIINYDSSIDKKQKEWASYSEPRGKDKMQALYFFIEQGQIVKRGFGSTKSSLHSENAGNDLADGMYLFHGETGSKEFRYARIFRSREQMNEYYKRNGKGIWNPGGNTSVPISQSGILQHYPTAPGYRGGSGGKGCQLFEGYDSWSRGSYKTDDAWRKYQGRYYKMSL